MIGRTDPKPMGPKTPKGPVGAIGSKIKTQPRVPKPNFNQIQQLNAASKSNFQAPGRG